MKDITKILLNPVRMRIVQHLAINKQSTTSTLLQELPDISQASLYRHMKKLVDSDILEVVEENRIRGTVEKVYALKTIIPSTQVPPSKDELMHTVFSFLMSIVGDFEKYSKQENKDPVKDLLFLRSATLLLSDEEYVEFLTTIGKELEKVMQNKPGENRKLRKFSTISSPVSINEKE